MKKARIVLLLLNVFTCMIFYNVQAEQNSNVLIQITNCPETVDIGEVFTAEIVISNVEKDFNCSAHWLYNDQIIDGYENKDYFGSNNKKSKLSFIVPLGTKSGSAFKIGFELIDGDKVYKVEKNIKVSSKTNNFDVKFTYVPSPIYKGDKVEIFAQITNKNDEKEFCIPVSWQRDGYNIEGYKSDAFTLSHSRDSVLRFNAPDKVGAISISFIINPAGIDGITQMSEVTEISVVDHPPEYYEKENKDRILSSIRKVDVEATVTKDTLIYSDMMLKNVIRNIQSGTKAIYFNYYEKIAGEIFLDDGTTGWVPFDILEISNNDYTVYDDFSNDDKELFVNIKEYKSNTTYLVWINLERQKINVFVGKKGSWKIEKIMPCATGRNETPTIAGVFKYSQLLPQWKFDEFVVNPVMIFNRGHAMHSQTYKPNGSLLDSTIGKPVSHGCVRMLQEDIDWMAYYIPLATTVVVY